MESKINPVHGGDWEGYREKYGRMPLDFSANISPLGLPEAVRKAWDGFSRAAEPYPDPYCRKLCRALGGAEGVKEDWILFGNGAADLIFRIAFGLRPQKALLAVPGFVEYQGALERAGCRIRQIRLSPENGFHVDKTFAEAITADVDMVFLCEPNNPTGVTTDPDLLKQILKRCRQNRTLLIVDECFNDFLEHPQEHSLKPYLRDYPNLLLLKAFTKIYAMAGLRVGYALCSNLQILEKIRSCGQPWPVSGPAQEAACAALSEDGYVQKVRTLIGGERRRIAAALTAGGLRVVPGEANFLLFQGPQDLQKAMEERGILIRDCSNFQGLSKGWFRIAIRLPEENDILLGALREYLKD